MDIIFLIIVFTILVFFTSTFTKTRSSLRFLFYFWIASFNFGPRGIDIGEFKLYYIEGITLAVFFLILMRFNFNIFNEKRIFPKYNTWLFCACASGVFTGFFFERSVVVIWREAIIFLMIIPSFYIVYIGFKYLNVSFNKIIDIFMVSSFILTLGGVLFYFFPALENYLPENLISGESVLVDVTREYAPFQAGIQWQRGGRSFWGLLLISAYLGLLFYPIWMQSKMVSRQNKKIFFIAACVLIIISIIISGHRSVWLGFCIALAFYAWVKGLRMIFLLFLSASIFINFLPHQLIARFLSSFDTNDWTVAIRLERYRIALEIWKANILFGAGWGSSGWVHNFILQLGANIGTIGLFIFLLWASHIFFVSLRLYNKRALPDTLRNMQLAFLTSVVLFLGPLVGESAINWSILMVPFWTFCAILHNFNNSTIQDGAYR